MNAFYKNLESQESEDWNAFFINETILSDINSNATLPIELANITLNDTVYIMQEYLKECIAEQF